MTEYDAKAVRLRDPEYGTEITLLYVLQDGKNYPLQKEGYGNATMFVSRVGPNGGRIDHDRYRFVREHSAALSDEMRTWILHTEWGELEDGTEYVVGDQATLA